MTSSVVNYSTILIPLIFGIGFLLGCLAQTHAYYNSWRNPHLITVVVWTIVEIITSILAIGIRDYVIVILGSLSVIICWIVYFFGG